MSLFKVTVIELREYTVDYQVRASDEYDAATQAESGGWAPVNIHKTFDVIKAETSKVELIDEE